MARKDSRREGGGEALGARRDEGSPEGWRFDLAEVTVRCTEMGGREVKMIRVDFRRGGWIEQRGRLGA